MIAPLDVWILSRFPCAQKLAVSEVELPVGCVVSWLPATLQVPSSTPLEFTLPVQVQVAVGGPEQATLEMPLLSSAVASWLQLVRPGTQEPGMVARTLPDVMMSTWYVISFRIETIPLALSMSALTDAPEQRVMSIES